jgi:hypothetical protein
MTKSPKTSIIYTLSKWKNDRNVKHWLTLRTAQQASAKTHDTCRGKPWLAVRYYMAELLGDNLSPVAFSIIIWAKG